ncbi:unnamed protein product [Brachionus calyciflorus]|uniref:Uncharacterized protein n=1 Tax=Brachionus calyciflorus TaxID=104777 RepID=A0A813QF85_9BILA|nr:unnamed protein product [Brachionus calyciflorus]
MEMNSAGSNNFDPNTNLLNEMNLNPDHNESVKDSHTDESSLILDQFEHDMDKILNEKLLNEKEQTNQRLFQTFQTSACAVAQMFKDKTTPGPEGNNLAWQSFQNSAGAITVLYKDSLEACKVHYDLGIAIGQQRKVKEIINWLKKKKRRSIRKDELISLLIGRQFSLPTPNSSFNPNPFANQTILNQNQQQQQTSSQNNLNPFTQKNRTQTPQLQTQTQSTQLGRLNSSTNVISENTCSDLATFREALIMHNRSRDGPVQNYNQVYVNSQNHHQHHQHNHQCDDLDCFFCEQIATHIEQKRSASNFDMESPTRKRGRFY